MDYETASYFEINKAVATDFGLKIFNTQSASVKFNINSVIAMCDVTGRWIKKDYCNNPSDAWPIIESIWDDLMSTDVNHNTEWDQEIKTDDRSDKLRAAMIVFLKMKESQS